MPTTTPPEDDKRRFENLPESFASALVEIERTVAALRTIEGNFKADLLRSLADVALAVEDQLKEAVTAAREAVRKQTQAELRAKYIKELELALTEKTLVERQLQIATKRFEEQKEAWTAKLD